MTYTDSTQMPFGKYKGEKLANVPASYLLWLHDNGCNNSDLKKYIEENIDDLNDEAESDRVDNSGGQY